ncbi:unnamed protein product [Sordaria macrospora k-hell]|uniref:WGS project CABT00000000 data, contig 2.36 n=2 Tax=Sordaria macrospora TaxID=5147 RepID=F7W6Y9_SORMK|nr:uncharacterized protein SMAC_07058 [Sordaria macrospora k-hell]KAH7631173.1 hypothetical protein B0T09DRAFT_320846 [Sordaria sp. MPI-SDFR-AT-0083]CCC13279.1 unnamed protein product [Sordaria macrospora k-hell]
MDEKTLLPTTTPTTINSPIPSETTNKNDNSQNGRDKHALRRILVAVCLMVMVWTLCGLDMDMDLDDSDGLSEWSLVDLSTINAIAIPPTTNADVGGDTTEHEPVALEAHIMSKCPDARDCLRELVLPAMQRVYTKVNFTLSFIGTPTNSDDGVACKHGPEECLGNIIELCAQKLYPDPKIFLGFTMCLTKNYDEIPQRSLIEDCALEHAIDFDKLNQCATKDDGALGMALLKDSVKRSADAGVTKSCTVRLDNEIFCIRDGGQWSDCPHGSSVNDLVLAVEKLYGREN